MRAFIQSAIAAAAIAYLARLAIVFMAEGVLRPIHVATVLQPALLLWLAGLVITLIVFAFRGFRAGGWSVGVWTAAVIIFAALDWLGLLSVPRVDLSF